MAWVNVNSLLGRADELRVFLDHESHKEIDILVLNETKLDPTIHHNENQASKYRAKTGKGGGGVAIITAQISTRDLSLEALIWLTLIRI